MAESHEENKRLLTTALLDLYTQLWNILYSLPIPLRLPTTVETLGMQLNSVMEAVYQAAQVTQDEPLPDLVVSVLADVPNLWNMAAITTASALQNEGDLFVEAAVTALAHADLAMQLLMELLSELPESRE